jgi:hypothetical protein
MAPGGRVIIINEAHGLRKEVIELLLNGLESMFKHTCIIFTTTKAGEERLEDGQIDAKPLMDRCLPLTLTNQGLAEAFASRVLEIMRIEGLGDCSLASAKRLIQSCQNSMRGALQAVDSGIMIGGAA